MIRLLILLVSLSFSSFAVAQAEKGKAAAPPAAEKSKAAAPAADKKAAPPVKVETKDADKLFAPSDLYILTDKTGASYLVRDQTISPVKVKEESTNRKKAYPRSGTSFGPAPHPGPAELFTGPSLHAEEAGTNPDAPQRARIGFGATWV